MFASSVSSNAHRLDICVCMFLRNVLVRVCFYFPRMIAEMLWQRVVVIFAWYEQNGCPTKTGEKSATSFATKIQQWAPLVIKEYGSAESNTLPKNITADHLTCCSMNALGTPMSVEESMRKKCEIMRGMSSMVYPYWKQLMGPNGEVPSGRTLEEMLLLLVRAINHGCKKLGNRASMKEIKEHDAQQKTILSKQGKQSPYSAKVDGMPFLVVCFALLFKMDNTGFLRLTKDAGDDEAPTKRPLADVKLEGRKAQRVAQDAERMGRSTGSEGLKTVQKTNNLQTDVLILNEIKQTRMERTKRDHEDRAGNDMKREHDKLLATQKQEVLLASTLISMAPTIELKCTLHPCLCTMCQLGVHTKYVGTQSIGSR